MSKKDPRVDAYIAKAAPFAQPILKHLRKIAHTGCPQLEETIKWGMPFFDYKGMLCHMAAFKQHCAFGFWKSSQLFDGALEGESEAMGNFGRITKVEDLPAEKVLIDYVRKAAQLNDSGVKRPANKKPAKPAAPVVVPDYFATALRDEQESAGSVRRLHSLPAEGIRRLDRRSEAERNARVAPCRRSRVDR